MGVRISAFSTIYIIFGVVIWLIVCAPLYFLYLDFNEHAWAFASTYSGLFIWPPLFMPFILLFLARPLKRYFTILQKNLVASNKSSFKLQNIWLITPIVMTIALTTAATFFETRNRYVAIWEISFDSPYFDSLENVGYNIDLFAHHGITYQSLVNDKSWPQIFYFLRFAARYIDRSSEPSDDLNNALELAQFNFSQSMKISRLAATEPEMSTFASQTRFYYTVSFLVIFSIVIFCLSLILLFLVIYLNHSKKSDTEESSNLFRGSFICFAAIIFCFFSWIPLRLVTFNVKNDLYGFRDTSGEIVIFMLFIIGFSFVLIRWWSEQTRAIVTVAGAILGILGISPVLIPELFGSAIERVEFFIVFALVYLIPTTAIWLLLRTETVVLNVSADSEK